MDVPILGVSDIGDLGGSIPAPPPSQLDPLPPRSSSPPLPPRKNAHGLPPTYLTHLRALLHQWLEQQEKPEDTGLPGPSCSTREKLWSDERLRHIESAIWHGAVLSVQRSAGKQRLLDLDWASWVEGCVARKQARKEERTRLESERDEEISKMDKRNKKKDVNGEESAARGRLSVPTSAVHSSSSSPSTPQKQSTRPPSIASSDRNQKQNSDSGSKAPLGTSPNGTAVEGSSDVEAREKEYHTLLAGLEGFQRYSSLKRDDWEVVDDKVPWSEFGEPDFPGAFPQAGAMGSHPREPSAVPSRSTPSKWRPKKGDIVKPLFCVHFASPSSMASTSTVHLRRGSTYSTESGRDGSVGSTSGKWWSATGSSRRWSGIGLGGSLLADRDEEVQVEFEEGLYALPSVASTALPRRSGSLRRKKKPAGGAIPESANGIDPSSDSAIEDDDEGDDSSSEWSNTQRPDSRFKQRNAMSLIIGGGEDDIPRQSVEEGKVGVVGGTIAFRGIRRDAERIAMSRVLHKLLYTIQAMWLELEVFDTFRIPRELDPQPLPPKRDETQRKSITWSSKPNDSSLRRNTSVKERGERTRRFFQRLGKDTKGMFEGLMGKSRNDSPPISRFREATPRPSKTEENGILGSTALDSPSPGHGEASLPIFGQATDRNLQILARLEKIRPSSTPHLHIPMPSLLLRVREEGRVRTERAQHEAFEDGRIDGLGDWGTLTPRDDQIRGRAKGHRLGGDIRAGLGSLLSGLDDFDGWDKLQRLETLVCSGTVDGDDVIICERPRPASHVFWGPGDDSIGDFISSLEMTETTCPRKECDIAPADHITWWFHGEKKVSMSLQRVEEGRGEIGMDAWVRCEQCKHTSEPRTLGTLAASYSWAKLLELLLYSRQLQPPGSCLHADTASSDITHFIRTPHMVVCLKVEPVSVLDTRLPKLQVGPNVNKRKAGKQGAVGAVDCLSRRADRQSETQTFKHQIEQVTLDLRGRLDGIRQSAGPPSPPPKESGRKPEEEVSTSADCQNGDLMSELDRAAARIVDIENVTQVKLEQCPPGQLNDVRRWLALEYEATSELLEAFEKKLYITKPETATVNLPDFVEDGKVHALPGSSILIRENEPSSVIAYFLSSVAYFADLTNSKTIDGAGAGLATDDPWRIEVSRKDTPRDLLSLRAVTKKRSEVSITGPSLRLPLSVAPNQPSLELSLEQVEGKSQGTSDRLGDLVRNISKATAQDPILTTKTRSPSVSESDLSATSTPNSKFESMVRRTSDTVRSPPSAFRPTRSVSSTVPSTPVLPSEPENASGANTPKSITASNGMSRQPTQEKEGWGSVTSTFTNSLNSLMRIGSEVGSFKVRGTDRSLSSLIGPLTMMSSMDNSLSSPNADDRPHIQFTCTLPDRMKISCTVYYATAFDSLRRRCAIDKSVIESLSRCDVWDAQGGKSKASFFMTKDKRYIVKELVSKWNVSDTQALLEIAPSYFVHLAGTHNRATSLAKIVGFYTVKIHDLQSSTKKAMDLLIMENLFYKQSITQTYDLKGIEGRKVPKTMTDGTTLFDNEWIKGQTRAPILLHPYAKRILQEAISNDTRYLSSQSIMDYSLLLGIDHGKKELVVGLVDAIGSYDLFRTIESRGKLALTRGGEVTIIPPDQYRERFENAIKQYFMACPDKWSKVPKRTVPLGDSLPSVF